MTDRIMVYPGAIPLETDLLYSNKFAMMGLAKLSAAMMGSTTYLHGLQCTPSSPASMVVNVAKGQIYSLQNVDNTAYSSLAADTVNTILKQGVILSSTAFTLTAPTTAGQSINYLIQVAYSDTDSGATVLPYYNAANPSVAYSGPNNSGAAQNTVRSGVCTVALKAGVAATTGTQTTPAADTGYTAAWVITVAQGATTVTSANIAVAANAQFLPSGGLVSAIQQCTMTYAADTGAANAYVAQFLPALPTLADGMRLTFKAKVANTGASTFSANGGSAYPLYSHANQALQGGEIVANGLIEVEWNSTLTAWVLCGNSGGALPVAPATASNQAPQISQTMGRNRLINSRFAINQRSYASGSVLALNAYGFDCWKASTASSSMAFTPTSYGAQVTVTGSFLQIIEGTDIEPGTYTLSWTGTAQGRVYNVGASAPAYAASPITLSVSGGLNVNVEFNAGTLFTPQLESGLVATTPERRLYQPELALCQRRLFPMNLTGTIGTYGGAGTYVSMSVFSPVSLRSTPTITLGGTSMAVNQSGVGTASTTTAAPSSGSITNNCITFNVTGNWTGLSAGVAIQVSSTPGLAFFSCEL